MQTDLETSVGYALENYFRVTQPIYWDWERERDTAIKPGTIIDITSVIITDDNVMVRAWYHYGSTDENSICGFCQEQFGEQACEIYVDRDCRNVTMEFPLDFLITHCALHRKKLFGETLLEAVEIH